MRFATFACAAALLAATPALAQVVVERPAAPPAVMVVPDVTGSVVAPVAPSRPLPPNQVETFVDSAKGGNAKNPNRMVPNLGDTSGGPGF
ncbi:hypothetical protein [Methylobacterium oryzihabitans]|uniref:Serine protease n=1 Tax=Methylobacterium oryzihabitans TaxID=2499852 RepID=A0A3S3UC15_9HYPH|nr:hypothetical protein [Methylobacterium oryzihabitans]RVU20521.1 hypothetical protein EOE48_04000 [Methylobacterium oryzihabitans]